MKKRIMRLIAGWLAILLLTAPASAASSFPDVDENAPYAEAVEYLNDLGIMQGDQNGNFNPSQPVTRAEMATLICRVLGETEDFTMVNIFTDVPVSHWANRYVTKAASLGIIGGYGDGRFGPSDPVTYEQAVTIVIRALGGESLAQEIGGYPDGFLCIAEDHGFLAGITAKKGEPLARGNIAILLFNSANFSFFADFDNAQAD